jgi:hypothetical protein
MAITEVIGTLKTSDFLIKGFNFQYGLTVSVYDPDIAGSESNYDVLDTKFLDDSVDTVFASTFLGQEDSTTLRYHADSPQVIPTNLSEGMFMKVAGPTTHNSYAEHRRISSFTSGNAGTITVVNPFSSSLSGASVSVFKKSSQVQFTLRVDSGATIGFKSVKITNPDSQISVLNNAILIS